MWMLRLRRFLKAVGKEGLILAWAIRHPATPAVVRLGALALFAYAISPVDLVPDVPGLGWLDDAAVLMVGIPFLLKRLPPTVLAEGRAAVERLLGRFSRRGPAAG
jgi:uncharacterized membrane protein YkvA (DUF1232 family)